MQAFKPGWLMHLSLTAGRLTAGVVLSDDLSGGDSAIADLELNEPQRSKAITFYARLKTECLQLELRCSLATCEHALARLASAEPVTFGELDELVNELAGRMYDEMSGLAMLVLDPKEQDEYANPRKGWERIILRFPDSVDHVEESRKCFALARYAAAVFHSVQIVEIGLIDLGIFLGVNDPKSGWTAVANELFRVVSQEYKQRSPFVRENYAFLEQVQGTVEALKNAWRNKISHAQGRLALMTPDFNREIAEEIIYASRSFMGRLESGLPLREEPK